MKKRRKITTTNAVRTLDLKNAVVGWKYVLRAQCVCVCQLLVRLCEMYLWQCLQCRPVCNLLLVLIRCFHDLAWAKNAVSTSFVASFITVGPEVQRWNLFLRNNGEVTVGTQCCTTMITNRFSATIPSDHICARMAQG
jgi:hypothetical protein